MDHASALGMLFGPLKEVLWAEILKETVESRRQIKSSSSPLDLLLL
jgi:hypothetical protein